jgi:hypothetical protein
MTDPDQIKSLMKSGDVAGAEALCRKALEADPDNAWLKRRYGICRRLQGDEETFRRISDELAQELEKKQPSRQDKYGKLCLALIVVSLVLGGAAAFKYVMIGVLVVAAIMAIIVHLWRPASVLHEYWTLGVLVAAVIAGMAVYIGKLIHNGLKVMTHTYDPAPDVVFVVDPAATNFVESATTSIVESLNDPIAQPSPTERETP